MDAKLSVEVGAKITELQTKMVQAEKSVASFAGKADKNLSKLAANGGQSLQNFAKGSSQAGFALTNFNRIVQDAPFGIIGIQNNIDPFLQSFQQLKKETGSTGGALKALGSSLIGPAGLLFAVTAITSALTVLSQNPEKVAGAINYLSGVVDDATESQKAYNEALIDSQSAAKVEIESLDTLVSIAKNETLSRNARAEALKKMKAEYPEQLEFLTLETIGSLKAAEAIDTLSKSILRKAKIQATEKLLGEAFAKQLEATTKSAAEQASTLSKVVGAALGAVGIKNFVTLQNGIENQAKAFKDAGTEIDSYSQILNKLKTEEAVAGTLFDDKKGGGTKSIKSVSDVLKDLRVDLQQISNDPGIKTFGEKNAKQFDVYRKSISELTEIGTKPANDAIKDLTKTAEGINLPFDKGFKAAQATVKITNTELNALGATVDNVAIKVQPLADKFLEAQNSIISSGFIEGFASIGEALGSSLANGESLINAFAKSALDSIGSVLIQFGKLTLAAGVASTALGQALSNPLNPGAGIAAIAAGVALIAVGAAVRGFSSGIGGGKSGESGSGSPRKIRGFASGGTNLQGGLALVGEKGPELVNLPSGSDVIPNHDLSGLGKMQPIVVIPDTVIRGRDIFISYNTEAALAKRNGL